MNEDTPLHWRSIAELSRQLRAGTTTASEVVEHLLARAERLNPALDTFTLIARDRAMAAAQAADIALAAGEDWGPLHGIPLGVKDIIDVRGLETSAGSKVLADTVADTDATVVQALRRAGMICLGKTQTVKFAMGAPGVNRDYGTPHNPWAQTHHVPGGSSSGSGVAVAAGLVPAALGTDTGGSVRIPASLCGTVGLKTTIGQVSRSGVFPLSSTLDSVGPLTRTVEDAALVYQAMHGPDPSDRSTREAHGHDVLSTLKDGVTGLRVAVAEGMFWEGVDDEIQSAVRAAIEVLDNQGARIESIEFPEARDALEANPRLLISSVEAHLAHQDRLGDGFNGYDPTIEFRLAEGANATAAQYLRAQQACERLGETADRTLREFDVMLTPTTLSPAMPLADVDASIESYQHWNAVYAHNTVVGNLLSLCAVSVPCGFTSQGLPIGLMVHARGRNEAMALRVAQAYETATTWHHKQPDLSWADS